MPSVREGGPEKRAERRGEKGAFCSERAGSRREAGVFADACGKACVPAPEKEGCPPGKGRCGAAKGGGRERVFLRSTSAIRAGRLHRPRPEGVYFSAVEIAVAGGHAVGAAHDAVGHFVHGVGRDDAEIAHEIVFHGAFGKGEGPDHGVHGAHAGTGGKFRRRGKQNAELGLARRIGGIGAVDFFLQAVEERHADAVVAFKFHNDGGAALRLAGCVVGRKGGGAHAQAGEQGRCGKKTKSFHAISLG